jgi:AcrR family transcriptional regulator
LLPRAKIAERIEYSPPVIYEYFDSKDDILLELMRLGYARQLEAVESARSAAGDPEKALFDMGRAWLDFAFRAPDLYQVMYGLGSVPLSAVETRKEGEKIGAVFGGVIKDILRKYGREVEDVDGKVAQLWASVHGLVALTMVGRLPGGQHEANRLTERLANDFLTAWRSS